jgi:hypothetical protein
MAISSKLNTTNELNRNQALSLSHPKPKNNESNLDQASSPTHSSSSPKDRFIAAKEEANTKHALEELQGGGKIPDLSILKQDLNSFKFENGANPPADTGTVCSQYVTRRSCR